MTHRWGRGYLAAGLTLLLATAATSAAGAEASPYLMVSDPITANPAAFPWRLAAVTAGPLAIEATSSSWAASDVAHVAGALAKGGGSWQALKDAIDGLPTEASEVAGASAMARAGVAVMAVEAWYAPIVTTASISLPQAFLGFMADPAGAVANESKLDGTALSASMWSDAAIRANVPVPIVPRLAGISSFSVGAGVHWLQGRGYFETTALGTLDANEATPAAKIVTRQASKGLGYALDVGLVAGITKRLSVEAAYVGAGGLTWQDVQETAYEVDSSSGQLTGASTFLGSIRKPLGAAAVVGVHWWPLPMGIVELTGRWARIGVDTDRPFDRLQAEANASLLGLLRAGLGAARDSDGTGLRVYGTASAGLGPMGLTVRVVNLQDLAKGLGARSLGVALALSLGF